MSVKVVYDTNVADTAPGRTVGELRRQFGAAFAIPAEAVATIDGVNADEAQVPAAGQRLAFTLPLGAKG